ncbi:MAG: hypothetical protein A2V66_10220 [Ignavibacteria bacterium RBG_13_36_8]|nr:MAG: hypothetical protein A2V66_10220 [Ignavibacteria bacterium RBG_13_36_8]
MILLKLNPKTDISLHKQIVQRIIEMIEKDVLPAGSKLPSTRQLSEKLGVDRSTVYKAYQELNALGYLESKPGSYTTVRKRPKVAVDINKQRSSLIDWEEEFNNPSNCVYEFFLSHENEENGAGSKDFLDFTCLSLDKRLFPIDDLRRCLNTVLVNQGKEILGYGSPFGYQPLREYIANRLQTHGISLQSDNILITNGCQQALDLIIKLFGSPDKKVVVEAPTYFDIIPLLKYYKVGVIEIPMLSDGLDLAYLEKKLKKEKPAFIYTIPNFHNPTGIATSQNHREELLSIAEKYKVPIIEDGFEEEMKYFGKVSLPIKSMDKNQIVFYLGTFSKSLFAGIRIGWIVADKECIKRLAALKKFTDLGSNTIVQTAMYEFCRNGYYDLHLKRIHRAYRKRMQTVLRVMEEELPENVTWTKPDGGYTIWVTLKESYRDLETLKKVMRENKVIVSPGRFFYYGPCPDKSFRISISYLNEEEILIGIKRLAKALRALQKK